jgi:hypothetical protein
MISFSLDAPCLIKLCIECGMACARLLAKRFKLSPAFCQVLVDAIPIRHVESERAEDLFETQRGKGIGNSFGRFASQKSVYNRVKREAGTLDKLSVIAMARVT